MGEVGLVERGSPPPLEPAGQAVVEIGGGVVGDPGVPVLVVVPGEEALAEGAGILEGPEALGEVGAVLEGLELALRVGVVVALTG